MHSQVLRELAEVAAKPLSIIIKNPGEQERCLMIGEKPMLTPIFRKGKKENLGNSRPVSLTFIPGKVMEHSEGHHQAPKVKKGIGSGQHGSTKRKSCLTNLMPPMGW